MLQNQKKVLEIALSRGSAAAASSSAAKVRGRAVESCRHGFLRSPGVADSGVPPQGGDDEPVFVPAKGFEMFSSRSGILLEVLFDPPRKLSHEQAIRLSLKDHARIWRVRRCCRGKEARDLHPSTGVTMLCGCTYRRCAGKRASCSRPERRTSNPPAAGGCGCVSCRGCARERHPKQACGDGHGWRRHF